MTLDLSMWSSPCFRLGRLAVTGLLRVESLTVFTEISYAVRWHGSVLL